MIAEAFTWKYGYATGFEELGGIIKSWPKTWGEQTEKNIENVIKEYTLFLKSQEYNELRKAEYPPIGDQLDVIWKEFKKRNGGGENLNNDTNTMINQILAVKAKYPNDVK